MKLRSRAIYSPMFVVLLWKKTLCRLVNHTKSTYKCDPLHIRFCFISQFYACCWILVRIVLRIELAKLFVSIVFVFSKWSNFHSWVGRQSWIGVDHKKSTYKNWKIPDYWFSLNLNTEVKVASFKLAIGESWVEFFMREHREKFKKRRIGM
jgi:hypothetical protein